MPEAQPVHVLAVASRLREPAQALQAQIVSLGLSAPEAIHLETLYFLILKQPLTPNLRAQLERLVSDPVVEQPRWLTYPDDGVAAFKEGWWQVEVVYHPGVADPTAERLLTAARRLGLPVQAAATGQRYRLYAPTWQESQVHFLAQKLLANPTVQAYALGQATPPFVAVSQAVTTPQMIPLRDLDDEGLLALSRARRLALDAAEMQAIQDYFRRQGREPTDAELETLAQTWSEHCVHKTFKAHILVEGGDQVDPPLPPEVPGLLRTFLQAATEAVRKPWLRSAFVDNAGVIALDDRFDLSFKVETHNHPSALEPFGGANTGVGGVVRDVLGVSHRPVAVTDVLCFGMPDLPFTALPEGVLHPRRVRDGVVAGIQDYGNKLGLPTVNGAVVHHPGYTANPLVYCGCVGLGPRGCHPRQPQPGDRIVLLGGRTGRDGLGGATFSSQTMDHQTAQVAGTAVQIGDPFVEKGVIEVVVAARERGLYHAITDCGAGGLSSAVGEMADGLGAWVDLQRVPLKYAGLAPWEIWLSEAQERMVLAVPPEHLPTLAELCATYEVEWADIGCFEASGRLRVTYGETSVVDLDLDFLHRGRPQRRMRAVVRPPRPQPPAAPPQAPGSAADLLLALLRYPGLGSKEDIVRRYDHEVRGATVVKPYGGPFGDAPADAAVLKPLETPGWYGFVLANGLQPRWGEVDAFAGAVAAADEAIRNAVAVGGDPDHLALLDNFCWGDPNRPETLGDLVRAAQACYHVALHYQAPFISGKDSLNNEYLGPDGERHAIPGTLLISAVARHPDVRRAVTAALKAPGHRVYLLGPWQPALAGSYAAHLAGPGLFGPQAPWEALPQLPPRALELYRALHAAILAGWPAAVHDLSEGGLALAAAEMAYPARLGLDLDLTDLHPDPCTAAFAETTGCFLVAVPPEHALAWEQALADFPCRWIGEVTPTPRLRLRHGEQDVLNLALDDLCRAAQGGQP